MSTVKDLERKEQSLEDQIKEVRGSLEKARQDELGLHIGDVVEWKGELCKVAYFEMWPDSDRTYRDRPWITAYRKKKDGTWRENAQRLYTDWKKP